MVFYLLPPSLFFYLFFLFFLFLPLFQFILSLHPLLFLHPSFLSHYLIPPLSPFLFFSFSCFLLLFPPLPSLLFCSPSLFLKLLPLLPPPFSSSSSLILLVFLLPLFQPHFPWVMAVGRRSNCVIILLQVRSLGPTPPLPAPIPSPLPLPKVSQQVKKDRGQFSLLIELFGFHVSVFVGFERISVVYFVCYRVIIGTSLLI